jgi:hypothetical protein
MPDYRVYFRGPAFIHGRHDFVAEDDVAAMVLAELLYEACSDRCEQFELWRGATMIHPSEHPQPSATWLHSQVVALRQETVRRNEELIRDSHWTIARSTQLLDRIREMEGEGVLPPDPVSDSARQRRLRMKAEELRAVADQMTHPTKQLYYRRLAANYEALAEHDAGAASIRRKLGETT